MDANRRCRIIRRWSSQLAAPWSKDTLTCFLMLYYALLFLLLAIVAGILGFSVIAGTAALIAKTFFSIFIALFVISMLLSKKKSTSNNIYTNEK